MDIQRSEELTRPERDELSALEEMIERNLASFVEAGNALLRIRDARLYRGTHQSFDGYCSERWGFGRHRAGQLMEAASVVGKISRETMRGEKGVIPLSDPKTHEMLQLSPSPTQIDNPVEHASATILPANEAQAREVAKAPPGQRKAAWDAAVESAPKDASGQPKVTAAHVKAAVGRVTGNGDAKPSTKPAKAEQARVAADGPAAVKARAAEARKGKAETPKPATPAEPAVPRDEVGVPLPNDPKVRDAFGARAAFGSLMARLSQLKSDAGRDIPNLAAAYFGRQAFEAHVANARHELDHARPYAVCPYCSGTGREAGSTRCTGCNGCKWVNETTWKSAPQDAREAMEAGHAFA